MIGHFVTTEEQVLDYKTSPARTRIDAVHSKWLEKNAIKNALNVSI